MADEFIPSFRSTATSSVLGGFSSYLAPLAILFLVWRILPLPRFRFFRRRRVLRRLQFFLLSSGLFRLFSYGALALAGLYLINPDILEQNLPGWRSNIGLLGFGVAAFALCGAVCRSLSNGLTVAMWLGVLLLLGQGVFSRDHSVETRRAGKLQIPAGYEEAFPTSLFDTSLNFLREPKDQQRVASSRRVPVDNRGVFTQASDYVKSSVIGAVGSFESGARDVFFSGMEGMGSSLGLSSNNLGLPPFGGDGTLPDSAYFAAPIGGGMFDIGVSGGGDKLSEFLNHFGGVFGANRGGL